MDIYKFKHNPKKVRKLNNEELIELLKLSTEELKRITKKASDDELKNFKNNDVNSWEKFIDILLDILEARN